MLKQREQYSNADTFDVVNTTAASRLDIIAHNAYGDAGDWERIARANAIMYFFDLPAGVSLYLPRAEPA